MALQFNNYFVQQYLVPTLGEMINDMGADKSTQTRGAYLHKLLKPEKLNAAERKSFHNEYFPPGKKGSTPFTAPEDAKYRDAILDELGTYIEQRIKLSGPTGMKAALIPPIGESYTASAELYKNMSLMAYRIATKFEKKRIAEIKGKLSAQEQEGLENGKLKLVKINGVEKVMTLEEIEKLPEGAEIISYIEPGLLRKLQQSGAAGQMADGEKVPPDQVPEVRSTKEQLKQSLEESRIESAREALEKSGLEVIELRIEGGQIVGKVEAKDLNTQESQELKVTIDFNAGNSNPRKIALEFIEPVQAGKSPRRFILSQNDLGNHFMPGGKRRDAEKAYTDFQASGGFKGSEKLAPSAIPEETLAGLGPSAPTISALGGKGLPPVLKKGEGKYEGKADMKVKTVIEGVIPGMKVPPKGGVQKLIIAKAPPRSARVNHGEAQFRPVAEPPKSLSIQDKKKKLAARKKKKRAGVRQQQQQQAAAQQAQQQVVQQKRQQQGAQVQAAKKRGNGDLYKKLGYVGAASGVSTAGPLFAWLGMGSGGEEAAKAVTFIIHCIGNICIG